ncbi:MAG TPA: hypothetical protein DD379_13880 [Cyanobacteria bacterium UBA11162]|nr:hypothetical protein [Cyanobacteria bacterium UBA11162]
MVGFDAIAFLFPLEFLGDRIPISPRIEPSCRSAAHFYEDCVKLIRILRVGVLINLIDSVERICVVVDL